MFRLFLGIPALLVACDTSTKTNTTTETPADSAVSVTADWTVGPVPADILGTVRGNVTRRGIVHLHSAWSHDACDGEGLIDGVPDEACVTDLREGLCASRIDIAWLTDHPSHAAEQPYEERMHMRPESDAWLTVDGERAAAKWVCADGTPVVVRPGYEDELMPVGMKHGMSEDPAVESAIANAEDAATIAAMQQTGALVAIAHTEGRTAEWLDGVADAGIGAVECFNLHAAFDPRKRTEDLGLDAADWLARIATFTNAEGGAEPDLFFLGVLSPHTPSLAHWDRLTARGLAVVGTAGTDAHQNTMPIELPDGERGDSYRRMLRWMNQHIRLPAAYAEDPGALQDALTAGHFFVVFEVLGSPSNMDVYLTTASGDTVEMGGESDAGGTLTVVCPTLAQGTPRSEREPEVRVKVIRDGALWAEGCGDHPTDGPGSYRVEYSIIPYHLDRFMGSTPDEWLVEYPWIYGQPIRVGLNAG